MNKFSEIPHSPNQDVIVESVRGTTWILERDQDFIFNPDLDGILSAAILVRYLGWNPVGICACAGRPKDGVWISSEFKPKPKSPVFVDIWAANPNLRAIDQHMVALSSAHAEELLTGGQKSNPNLYWKRIADSKGDASSLEYKWKYPFGVVHFIIAVLEGHGIRVDFKNRLVQEDLSAFDILLRADDAGKSTATKYRPNCISWWKYLCMIGGGLTDAVSDWAIDTPPEKSVSRQEAVESFIKLCGSDVKNKSKDGNFTRHFRERCDGFFDQAVANYVDEIVWSVLGERGLCVLPCGGMEFVPTPGERHATYQTEVVKNLIDAEDLFTYAFTAMYGPAAAMGFSHSHSDVSRFVQK